jgi:hypothetical protein
VFNLIKEENDPATGKTIPHKYVSGGVNPEEAIKPEHSPAMARGDKVNHEVAMADLSVRFSKVDSAMKEDQALDSRVGSGRRSKRPFLP